MNIRTSNLLLSFAVLFLIWQLSACKKDQFITENGAGLEFSLDTLTFDTVFTGLGNATRRFKVYNPHDQIILLKNVFLGGGDQSDFNINIDGFTGSSSNDIEIPAGDSIYIFANVYIDPNNGDAIRKDSILFETEGGGTQKVVLFAYGWNANYIGQVGYLTSYTNTTLTLNNSKPYIFMGVVAIDSNSCIVIPGGTEIYMFGGPTTRPGDRALLYIGHESCIESNVGGNLSNPVEFKTHRLEEDYQFITFHHNGIYLSKTSRNNIIDGTIIRNAVDGVFVDSFSTNSNYKLSMNSCKIYNVERSGVLGRGADIKMTNTVIANSNQYNFIGIRGGNYNFRHCTFVNYGTDLVSRSEAIISYRDYEVQIINGQEVAITDDGEAYFTNCIIYGNKREEIEILTANDPPVNFDYTFTNCLMKVDTFSQNMINCITNLDPLFVDIDAYDFKIDSIPSPANDAGTSTPVPSGSFSGPSIDIIGINRSVDPAIGAYAIPN